MKKTHAVILGLLLFDMVGLVYAAYTPDKLPTENRLRRENMSWNEAHFENATLSQLHLIPLATPISAARKQGTQMFHNGTNKTQYYNGTAWIEMEGEHGELDGLADDDHTQYFELDGSDTMTGAIDQAVSSLPAGARGRLVFDSATNTSKYYNGTHWIEFGNATGVADHGGLTGLADDDHTQYFELDGSDKMTGGLVLEFANSIMRLNASSGNPQIYFQNVTGEQFALLYDSINHEFEFWDLAAGSRWKIDVSGHLLPSANDTHNLGSATAWVANAYITNAFHGDIVLVNGFRWVESFAEDEGDNLPKIYLINDLNQTIMSISQNGDMNISGILEQNYNFDDTQFGKFSTVMNNTKFEEKADKFSQVR